MPSRAPWFSVPDPTRKTDSSVPIGCNPERFIPALKDGVSSQEGRMKHTLKTWPPYFEHAMTGVKTFELRRADREFDVGHEVELVEWDFHRERPTGRRLVRRIVYVLGGTDAQAFGLKHGHVVLGLAP